MDYYAILMWEGSSSYPISITSPINLTIYLIEYKIILLPHFNYFFLLDLPLFLFFFIIVVISGTA